MRNEALVEWGGRGSIGISEPADLDDALERADQEARAAGLPQAVEISRGEAGTLSIVVGLERSFLTHVPANREAPYMSSVGDEPGEKPFTFYVFGNHHSEAPWRNTVAPGAARLAARHFLATGELDPRLKWEAT